MSERLVFVRLGWMRWYGQHTEVSGPIGGGRFNEENTGSEVENFRRVRGWYRGYAQVSRDEGGFNLERVAGKPVDSDKLSGVLVVSVALRRGLGQVVVGWHREATLFRSSDDRPGRAYGVYNFEARDAVLLDEAERFWLIPKGTGGMGQANVFYSRHVDGRKRREAWIATTLSRMARRNLRRSPGLAFDAEEGDRRRREASWISRNPRLVSACLARDGHSCRYCGFAVDEQRFAHGPDGLSGILQVHHMRPLAYGRRRTQLEDLIALCPTCHAVAHAVARATLSPEVNERLLRRFYTPR